MKIFTFVAVAIFFIGCNNQKAKKKKINNKIIETIFINDSIYEGLTKSYSLSGTLESKARYTNGINDGEYVNYYSNGRVYDSMHYYMGYKNGYNYVYDSVGNVEYIDFFFFNRRMGSKLYYKQGQIEEYYFVNFEGNPLFVVDYDSVGIPNRFGGDVINSTNSRVLLNGDSATNLLLYLIDPPKIKIKYFLCQQDSQTNENKTLNELTNSGKMFIDTTITSPPVGWKYFIKADYFDSLNNFHKIHIQPVEWGNVIK